MNIEDVKNVEMLHSHVEGILNDFESGLSEKDEVHKDLGECFLWAINNNPDPMQEIIEKIEELNGIIGADYELDMTFGEDGTSIDLININTSRSECWSKYNPTEILSKLNELIKEARGGE